MPHRPRTKAESDKEAVAPGHGTVRATRSASKTTIRVKTGLSPMTRKPSSSPKYQHDPGLGLDARARGQRCSMRWTSADVAFRGVARASMWIPFPRGTFIWKRWCGTIAGLNAQTGIARREVDRRGRRGTAAEKLRGFPFSFRFNHQRIQMANAEAKLTSGDRSRKLALDIFLDQLIES